MVILLIEKGRIFCGKMFLIFKQIGTFSLASKRRWNNARLDASTPANSCALEWASNEFSWVFSWSNWSIRAWQSIATIATPGKHVVEFVVFFCWMSFVFVCIMLCLLEPCLIRILPAAYSYFSCGSRSLLNARNCHTFDIILFQNGHAQFITRNALFQWIQYDHHMTHRVIVNIYTYIDPKILTTRWQQPKKKKSSRNWGIAFAGPKPRLDRRSGPLGCRGIKD